MISAANDHRDEGMPFAIDNGEWSYKEKGWPFDDRRFRQLLDTHGERADFVAVPDIFAGGLISLRFSERWLSDLGGIKQRLIVVQDGMSPWDVEPLLGPTVGIFIGGSTDYEHDPRGGWKWRSIPFWAHLARKTGCYLHVGRVNSTRWIRECIRAGADSFDGSSPSRWLKNQPKLDASRQQTAFRMDEEHDQ